MFFYLIYRNWNATIQTHTNNAGDIATAAYDYASNGYSDLCEKLETEFGEGDCTIDPGIIQIYGDKGGSSAKSGDSAGAAIVAVVVVLIIVLILIGGGIFYQKMQANKHDGQVNAADMSSHMGNQQPTQTNIVTA